MRELEDLAGVIKTDEFTRRIWDIYERCGAQEGRHRMELGVLRSDYMLDEPSGLPLQVEVNTVSTSFMALSTRVGEMHRHTISRAGLVSHYAPRAHDGSDRDLDDAMRRWLASPAKGVAIDRSQDRVRLSRIFDWFEEDFRAGGGVLATVARYVDAEDARWLEARGRRARVEFLDYDWALNDLRSPSGSSASRPAP